MGEEVSQNTFSINQWLFYRPSKDISFIIVYNVVFLFIKHLLSII